jgi:hypothetical protein
MEHKNAPVYLGDLARALGELGIADPPTIRRVATLLGLDLPEEFEAPRRLPTGGGPSGGKQQEGGDGRGPGGGEQTEDEQPEEAKRGPEFEPRAVPTDLQTTTQTQAEWDVVEEPFLPQAEEELSFEPPPLTPLLTPRWTRAILSASLATEVTDGPINIEQLTEMLARRENVERLPTVRAHTTRRGAQLLLDWGAAMAPFARDQAWLAREVRWVAGGSQVSVAAFIGSPLRGAGTGPPPWPEYRPPSPGTPIALLTDLGLCRGAPATERADEAEWVEFVEAARRANCPVVAFVPYGPSQWPRALARRLTLIHWDRATTAATLSRTLKLSREASRP